MASRTKPFQLAGAFLKRSHVVAAWAALAVSLWSAHSVRAAHPVERPQEPAPAAARTVLLRSSPAPRPFSALPDGCDETDGYAIGSWKDFSIAAMPRGSTAWTTPWSVDLDPSGRAFLPPQSTVVKSKFGTATTRVTKDRSGAVSVVQCEPRMLPSNPDVYAGGVHLDVGGPGWLPVTLTVPACLTYQAQRHGTMQAEDCDSVADPASPHVGETAPRYVVELQIKDMRPGTSGWTQSWAVIRDEKGNYLIDPSFALEKTRGGNAEIQIVKAPDGALTAICPDREAASEIGPNTYRVKADLPIRAEGC